MFFNLQTEPHTVAVNTKDQSDSFISKEISHMPVYLEILNFILSF